MPSASGDRGSGLESASDDSARSGTRRTFLAAAGGLAGGGGAVYFANRFAGAPQPAYRRITFRRGAVQAGRFAADGQALLYEARWEGALPQIFFTRLDSPVPRQLEIPPAHLMSVSRTGELAIVLERGSTLARVPREGGPPREVLRNVVAADWAPDGSALLIVRNVLARSRIEFPIGKVIYETSNQVISPRLSPDGRRVAFFEFPAAAGEDVTLRVIEAGGGRRILAKHCRHALGLAWKPDGKEIWFSDSPSNQAPFLQAVNLDGHARPLLRLTVPLAIQDVAAGGRVLFTGVASRVSMLCRAAADAPERDLSWLDFSVASDIARDGSAVLFSETHDAAAAAGRQAVAYLRRTDGAPAVALGGGRSLGLSPDGQWAAVVAPTALRQLRLVPTAGGEQRVLEQDRFRYYDARWFPDGKRLLVWGNEEERLRRHYIQDPGGGPLRPLTPAGAAVEAAISPDGELVAAYSGPGIFLFPVDGSEPEPVRGDTTGTRPIAWTPDGRTLVIRRRDALEQLDLRSGTSAPWKDLTPPDPGGVTVVNRVFLTADGQGYVYSCERYQSDLYLAEALR